MLMRGFQKKTIELGICILEDGENLLDKATNEPARQPCYVLKRHLWTNPSSKHARQLVNLVNFSEGLLDKAIYQSLNRPSTLVMSVRVSFMNITL